MFRLTDYSQLPESLYFSSLFQIQGRLLQIKTKEKHNYNLNWVQIIHLEKEEPGLEKWFQFALRPNSNNVIQGGEEEK